MEPNGELMNSLPVQAGIILVMACKVLVKAVESDQPIDDQEAFTQKVANVVFAAYAWDTITGSRIQQAMQQAIQGE